MRVRYMVTFINEESTKILGSRFPWFILCTAFRNTFRWYTIQRKQNYRICRDITLVSARWQPYCTVSLSLNDMLNQIGKPEDVLLFSAAIFAHARIIEVTKLSRPGWKDEYRVHASGAEEGAFEMRTIIGPHCEPPCNRDPYSEERSRTLIAVELIYGVLHEIGMVGILSPQFMNDETMRNLRNQFIQTFLFPSDVLALMNWFQRINKPGLRSVKFLCFGLSRKCWTNR